MKKVIMLAIIFAIGLVVLTACGGNADEATAEALAGIIEIHGSRLSISPSDVFVLYNAGDEFGFVRDMTIPSITFIERNDTDLMAELGLSLGSFTPSGYYVRESGVTRTFEITDETEFVFVDNLLLFDTDLYGDRRHTTNSLDDFLEYFFPTVIHFIEVYDGRVVRLVQEFGFTM